MLKNITIINISLLFILLLLQLDNLYVKSYAQVETQDEKNLDLSGIWKKTRETYPTPGNIMHITQKGNEITATWPEIGACDEDINNEEGIAGGILEFRGTLNVDKSTISTPFRSGAIHGDTVLCLPEQKTSVIHDFYFIVSERLPGRFLLGQYIYNEYGDDYQVDYQFVSNGEPKPMEVAIGSGVAAVAAVGTGLLFYKHGYFKGIKYLGKTQVEIEKPETKSEIKGELPIIEVKIECGLENPELIKREGSKFHKPLTGEITELEQKFSEGINKILESRKKLKSIQKDIEFIKWCKEAKEDPNKILSKILQDVIGKFLSSIEPYFQNLMLSQISIESDISVTEDRPKQIKKNITFSLIPIPAYIELVVYNNGLRVSSTKFVFTLNSYVKIKNLVVRFAKVNLSVDSNDRNNNMGKRIEIENLLFGINIELSKLKVGPIEKTIKPPLEIGRKEAEIKNILFFSGQTKEIS